MTKSSSLLQRAKELEKSLLEIEINMISTLLKAGISRELADFTVKKIIHDSDYNTQLEKIKEELSNMEPSDE